METINDLLLRLGELAATNGAAEISTRVQAIRAQKASNETVNKLAEIIDQLVSDRSELLSIARALDEEIVAQRIDDEDLEFIVSEVVPTVEKMIKLSPGDKNEEAMEAVTVLLRKESLDVLQVLGFNFKEAIGKPLTMLMRDYILSITRPKDDNADLTRLTLAHQTELIRLVSDPEAFARFQQITSAS